jgi:phosphatidylserine synthase
MGNHAAAGSVALDSWIDRRLHRPLSKRVTRVLLLTSITATQVTLLSLAAGLAAGWCLGQGRLGPGVLGLALFYLSAVLDHSDGEVARATSTESALGHFLDNISDGLVALTMLAGMSWQIARHLPSHDLALIGWTIAAGLPLCFIAEWKVESLRAAIPLPDHRRRILFRIMNTLTSREPLYVFVLLYLFVTAYDGDHAWRSLGWTFAVGVHLFWIGMSALGHRFFGLRAMILGASAGPTGEAGGE